MSKIIWTEPVARLLESLQNEADMARRLHDARVADLLADAAERLAVAIEEGSGCEYVDSAAAAEFLSVGEEAVRARCRRKLLDLGLARKRGGRWEIHTSVLAA